MSDPEPRVRLSATQVAPGEVIEVRTLIAHPMESGHRRDADGELVPRHIISVFRCALDGEVVFACDLEPAISANPYLQFTVAPQRSGTLTLTWIDDDGHEVTASETITVG
jgi:sulfur-oxidizing protein SoxZ